MIPVQKVRCAKCLAPGKEQLRTTVHEIGLVLKTFANNDNGEFSGIGKLKVYALES